MASNRLVINDSKTKLIVFGNKHIGSKRDDVTIKAGAHTIKPVASHKLLGAVISQSLRWSDHLINHEQSLLKQLRTRLNGLSLISRNSSFRTKLMVAQGIFMSKLVYLIQVWGGTTDYAIKSMQVMQNKAAKAVTGQSWFTPT